MQFRVGDQVVHPVYGVGRVKTLTQQRFAGEKARKYYEVMAGGLTVWVPIDEEGSTVLRGVAPKDSLDECRRLLKGRPLHFSKDRQVRQLEIASRLEGRLLPALCEIVRDLRADGLRKPLGAGEQALLKKCFKALCDEWAASEAVTEQTALHEIESLLQATHRD